jgi:ATP-dependent DNA ligase
MTQIILDSLPSEEDAASWDSILALPDKSFNLRIEQTGTFLISLDSFLIFRHVSEGTELVQVAEFLDYSSLVEELNRLVDLYFEHVFDQLSIPEDFESVKIWWLPTLHKKSVRDGNIWWKVGFDRRTSELTTQHGHVGGKTQTARRAVVVNLSGRSIDKQAVLEVKQEYAKKVRKDNYHTASQPPPSLGQPMLASKFERGKTKVKYPVLLEPKLDGIRCMIRLQDGEILLRSRGGKSMNHISPFLSEEIKRLLLVFPHEVELDGELFIPTELFENITSVVRGEKLISKRGEKLEYHIFTYSSSKVEGALDRMRILEAAFKAAVEDDSPPFTKVKLVEHIIVSSEEEMMMQHEKYTKEEYSDEDMLKYGGTKRLKYEGTMIYKTESNYSHGRGSHIMKIKDFQDEEGTVQEVTEGIGKHKGMAILTVLDPRGNLFKVTPSMDDDGRRNWWENKDMLLGKLVTYKYQELNESGVPRFANVIGIRDYE